MWDFIRTAHCQPLVIVLTPMVVVFLIFVGWASIEETGSSVNRLSTYCFIGAGALCIFLVTRVIYLVELVDTYKESCRVQRRMLDLYEEKKGELKFEEVCHELYPENF